MAACPYQQAGPVSRSLPSTVPEAPSRAEQQAPPPGPGQATPDQALAQDVASRVRNRPLTRQPSRSGRPQPHSRRRWLCRFPRPLSLARLFCLSMPNLSVALEAMQRHHPWVTLRIAGIEWRHRGLQKEAFERAARAHGIHTVTLNSSYVRPEEETEPCRYGAGNRTL